MKSLISQGNALTDPKNPRKFRDLHIAFTGLCTAAPELFFKSYTAKKVSKAN